MALSKTIAFIAWIAVIAIGSSTFIPHSQKSIVPIKGFAVIELFTSEGCSSCPPADALIAKIQNETNNQPVLILAYHVDYWNRLGWKDVFSSHAYSERQHQYSNWLKLNGVYTPQVVVNGRKEFIGSDESSLRNAIKSSLQNESAGELRVTNIMSNNHQVELNYHAREVTASTSLVLAIIQKAATTQVRAGENGGLTLSHVQIVRNVQTVDLEAKNSGSANIALPEGLNSHELELIAFLQNNTNGEITAAAKSALPSASILARVNNKK